MVTSSLPEKVVLDKAGLIILRTFEMDYNKAGSALTGNEEGDPSHSNSVIMASWLIARSWTMTSTLDLLMGAMKYYAASK